MRPSLKMIIIKKKVQTIGDLLAKRRIFESLVLLIDRGTHYRLHTISNIYRRLSSHCIYTSFRVIYV